MTATIVAHSVGVAGYWLVTANGAVHSFGAAKRHGSLTTLGITAEVVGMVALADGSGYWLVGSDGGIFAFGGAEYWGSVPGVGAAAHVVGMAAIPDGSGYWLLGADGNVFAFGAAEDLGSLPRAGVTARAIGITALDDGAGYWVVSEAGTTYAFGDARDHGSVLGLGDSSRVVGMSTLGDEAGYWLVSDRGAVFAFGTALDHGSAPPAGADVATVAILSTSSDGYLLVRSDGAVLPFGGATFHGSMVETPLAVPVVGSATFASPLTLGAKAAALFHDLQSDLMVGGQTTFERERTTHRLSRISFPVFDAPRVSIVIPVHGKSELTVKCLRSIANVGGAVPFEVIVVDDDSPDDTATLLRRVNNVKVVRNPINIGFTRSCNAGIAIASGEYVILLNNDTEVTSGWIDDLTATADADGSVGIVGAKLLYPDGNLQEAGGIIWNDGSGMNYGRGDRADLPAYEYKREVDYCSGACILVRRDLLARLGGLDEQYAPAYYEDVDLAFAARALGYKVVYQPKVQVVHDEGGSHGTDVSAGVKRFQNVNRVVFAEKWARALEDHFPPDVSNAMLARDTNRGPRALIIDHMVPTYDQDAGSVRMLALVSMLVELGFSVSFLPANQAALQPYTEHLQQMGVEVLYGSVAIGPYMRQFGRQFKLCILSRPQVACQFIGTIRAYAPWAAVIYDTVDLHFVRERRYGEVHKDDGAIKASTATREIELALVRASDLTLTVTSEEREVVLVAVPEAKVSIIPTIHAGQPARLNPEHRHGLLFVGSFCHDPNRDCVTQLVNEVMPRLRLLIPSVHLTIVGSSPTPEVMELAVDDVEVLGWVSDLEPLYDQARVFVAPLRFGAGMKGKIGEALSHGLPTVTSSIGTEGMGLVPEQHILVADDADAFAAQVVRLHDDQILWARLAEQGQAHVARHYSPVAVREQLQDLLNDLGVLPIETAPGRE